MNIIFSGWPGAGTTTVALLTAHLLQYKYLYAGGLMKYFAMQIVGAESGEKFIQFEEDYGNAWDEIWEKYAKWKITNTDKLVIEGKTLGFLMEQSTVFEIMVIASQNARAARAVTDGRIDPINTIKSRDKVLRERFKRDMGIDIYDQDEILSNYDLLIDNTELNIASELEIIMRNLYQVKIITEKRRDEIIAESVELEKAFWAEGKTIVREKLQHKGLLLDPQTILTEWNLYLTNEVENLPIAMKTIVRSFQD